MADGLRPLGRCLIPGRLLDLGRYPGLVSGDGRVEGELVAVVSPETWRALDRFEGYRPGAPDGSLFIRSRVRLVEPEREAWVYRWTGLAGDGAPVSSGDWRRHLEER